jgi:hypothetical protein
MLDLGALENFVALAKARRLEIGIATKQKED